MLLPLWLAVSVVCMLLGISVMEVALAAKDCMGEVCCGREKCHESAMVLPHNPVQIRAVQSQNEASVHQLQYCWGQ